MSFEPPTLKDLSTRISTELATSLGIELPLKKRSILSVFAQVLAGSQYLLHAHLTTLADGLYPDTARGRHLERWAARFGLKRKRATRARGYARFQADSDSPTVQDGATLTRDDGIFFKIKKGGIITGKNTVFQVEAFDEGAHSNTPSGTILTLVEPIAGVNPQVTVEHFGISEGFDIEDDEQLRERVLLALKTPTSCGSESDFKLWALEVPGVAKVLPLILNFNGVPSISVAVLVDNIDNFIPSSEKQLELLEHLKDRAPAGFGVEVLNLEADPVQFEIELIQFSTEEKKSANSKIEMSLKKFLFENARLNSKIEIQSVVNLIKQTLGGRPFILHSPSASLVTSENKIKTFGGLRCT